MNGSEILPSNSKLDQNPGFACRAWLAIEFAGVADIGAGALGASVHWRPVVNIELLAASQAMVRNIVANASH